MTKYYFFCVANLLLFPPNIFLNNLFRNYNRKKVLLRPIEQFSKFNEYNEK